MEKTDVKIADYNFEPMIITGPDFVSDLLQKYLMDLKNRDGEKNFEQETFTGVMRRSVLLTDATVLIEDLNNKSLNLKTNLAKKEAELAKRRNLEEHIARIKKTV